MQNMGQPLSNPKLSLSEPAALIPKKVRGWADIAKHPHTLLPALPLLNYIPPRFGGDDSANDSAEQFPPLQGNTSGRREVLREPDSRTVLLLLYEQAGAGVDWPSRVLGCQ